MVEISNNKLNVVNLYPNSDNLTELKWSFFNNYMDELCKKEDLALLKKILFV